MIQLHLLQQLQSLRKLLSTLSENQYTCQIQHLGNVSIGAHTRHIIELLSCAVSGYDKGQVDYVNRIRNLELEINKDMALVELQYIELEIEKPDKALTLVAEQIEEGIKILPVNSSYYREIVYNTEHSIHHLALIKVALIEMKLEVVDPDFGMAYSTIRYRETISQS